MAKIIVENEILLDVLVKRVENWTTNEKVKNLYKKMYEYNLNLGVFDNNEFDVNEIVDNDFVNWCEVIEEDDENFEKILKLYKENGLGDISCESNYGYIEAVDNEEEPKMFLVRY